MDKGLVTEKFISILSEAADKDISLLRSKTGGIAMTGFRWNSDIENFAKTGKLGVAEIVQWKELNLKQQHAFLEILNKYHNADDGEKLINVDMILCAMKAPGYENKEVAKNIARANTWVPESFWRPFAVTYQSQRPTLGLDAKFHRLKGEIDGRFNAIPETDNENKQLEEFQPQPVPEKPKTEEVSLPSISNTSLETRVSEPSRPFTLSPQQIMSIRQPTPEPTPQPTVQPTPEPKEEASRPEPEPKTIKVVRHRYGEGEAHNRAVAHAKMRNSDTKRLTPQEREIALQNLQRMEELGLIAKGPDGTSNQEVYLYRLYQSTLYYHLQEKIKMSDGAYEPVSHALGSESGKNHKEVYKDLTTQKLDDETLEDYARTVNLTEGCITNKGEARTTHKIPVRGKSSFKAGISNNVEIAQEEITVLNNTLKSVGQQYTEESKEYDHVNAVAMNQSSKSSGMC